MFKIHQVPTKFQPGEEVLVYDAKNDAMVRGVVVRTMAFLDGSIEPGKLLPEWRIEYCIAFRGYEQSVPECQLIRHDRWTIEFPPLDADQPVAIADDPVAAIRLPTP